MDVVAAKDLEVERLRAALISQPASSLMLRGSESSHGRGIPSPSFADPRTASSGDAWTPRLSQEDVARSDAGSVGSSVMPDLSVEGEHDAKLRFSAHPLYLNEQEEDIQFALDNELIDAKQAEDMLRQLQFDNAEITFDYEQI